MKIKRFTFNMFGVNTYILWDPETLQAAIIDPGMITSDDNQRIDSFIKENNLKLIHLINTHLHLDHTFGDDYISTTYGLKLQANDGDSRIGQLRSVQARGFGMVMDLPPLTIHTSLNSGDKINLGNQHLVVSNLPGHSPGSIVLYSPEDGFVLTGDVLFCRSIGRTDLAGGNFDQLIKGIRNILLPLPDSTIVYPGHGEPTTIGEERSENMWIK